MTHTIYLDIDKMENKMSPRAEVLVEIGMWLGQQGITPLLVHKELFDPCLKMIIEHDDQALAVKMRFPIASPETVNRMYERNNKTMINGMVSGSMIASNSIQANRISYNLMHKKEDDE